MEYLFNLDEGLSTQKVEICSITLYAGYPIFKREWQNVLQVGKSSVWTIANFNRYTKDKVDLSACRTVEEAWNELDMHFANPMTVSADVMSNFANYKLEGN